MISLIVNPSAGGGRAGRALPRVRRRLSELGLDHRLGLTRSLDHARELAGEAAQSGELAVGFGGDGLIGALAGALRETDGVLGVLPGGRGNDFARVLGIPLEPEEACAVLARGEVRRLDLGSAGGRPFIGIASCGFDSVANRFANEAKVIRGNLVYLYGALRALAGWRAARFEIRADGDEVRRFVGYTIAAANSAAYGGGMFLAPDASLEDGRLDIVVIGDVPKLRFLARLPTVFRGTHVRQPNVHVMRAAEVEVSSDRRFMLYADGDPIGELPITIRALPRTVNVLVPASATI